MATTFSTKHLTTHEAICDAAIRFTQGIDDDNAEILASAFTEDAVADFTDLKFLAPRFGVNRGRQAIVDLAITTVGKMDTTHMTSNFRTQVSADGKSAHLTCYALAQHWRPGQGRSHAFGSNFLQGNRYDADLVFDGELWRFKSFVLRTDWSQGDWSVMDLNEWRVVHGAVKEGTEKAGNIV